MIVLKVKMSGEIEGDLHALYTKMDLGVFSIIEKPSGQVVQQGKLNQDGTLFTSVMYSVVGYIHGRMIGGVAGANDLMQETRGVKLFTTVDDFIKARSKAGFHCEVNVNGKVVGKFVAVPGVL